MQKKNNNQLASYKFTQLLGYKGPNQTVQKEDIITSIKYDKSGKFIAVGDQAGRIIIFQNAKNQPNSNNQLNYLMEFQSHTPEFDPLKSKNVQQAIVDINWLTQQGKYLKMITTNSKQIKIWKIYQKSVKKVIKSSGSTLSIPKMQNYELTHTAQMQRKYPSLHLNPIKQISQSCNQQYLLSTDQAQMFLWNIQQPQKPYLICDSNQLKIDSNAQQLNCCQMHPNHDSIFLFGMSKGSLKLGDLRVSANINNTSINFKHSLSTQRNLLLDLISNISSVSFSKDNKYLVSRDYLTIKIWDICNNKKPVNTIHINDCLKSKLSEMVQNQSIYDEFKMCLSPDNSKIVTGSYNNYLHVMDYQGNNCQYQLNYKKNTIFKYMDKTPNPVYRMDYSKKILACDYHANSNTIAAATLNSFFTYSLSNC